MISDGVLCAPPHSARGKRCDCTVRDRGRPRNDGFGGGPGCARYGLRVPEHHRLYRTTPPAISDRTRPALPEPRHLPGAALAAGTSYTAHPERADPRLMTMQLSTNLGWMEAVIPSLAGEPLSQNHPRGWLYVAARSESIGARHGKATPSL